MKRIFALFALFTLLLTGCAEGQTDKRVEELQRKYAGLNGCGARAVVAVARDGETRRYTLDIAKEGDETRVTVLEPEALAGISAIVSGDALALEFDGMVLDAGSTDERISAARPKSSISFR